MLMLTALNGFGAGGAAPKANVLIDRTAGTNIGNATAGGGLAAAFDGVTSQLFSAAATSVGAVSSMWLGKTLAAPKIFGQAILYPSSDRGCVTGAGTPNVTLNIRGKNGTAPASATDGTILGTITFVEVNSSAGRTVTSTDFVNVWDHLFVEMIQDGGTNQMFCAELEMWEWA